MIRTSIAGLLFALCCLAFTFSDCYAQTVKRVGTTVTVTGTTSDDNVVATFTAPSLVTITANGIIRNYPRSQVRLLVVNLGDGNDTFVASTCPFNCQGNRMSTDVDQ